MTIQEGIKHKGFPFWIPGAKRSDLPEFIKQKGFKKGVEIGVSWAQNIVDYAKAGLEIYGIDPWKDSRDNIYRKIISIPGNRARTIDDVCSRRRRTVLCIFSLQPAAGQRGPEGWAARL